MSHRIEYKKVRPAPVSSTEEKTDVDSDINTDIDDIKQPTIRNKDDDNKKQRVYDIKSCGDFCKWLITNPTSKLPFLYFFISIFIPFALGIYYFMDNNTAYIIAGISGLTVNIYGLNHFRTLINLKHEIDNFHLLNKQFSKENRMLNIDVDKLLAANDNLKDMHSKLSNINIKQKENLQKFRSIQDNLKLANLDSIEGITNVREKAKKMGVSWKEQLLRKERDVLYKVFDRFEQSDKTDGMTKDEFDEFSDNVPSAYQDRFNRLGTFRKLAAGKSYIDYKDFQSCLDIFAQMNVEDVDMDFIIERKQQKQRQQKQPQYQPQLLSIPSEQIMPGFVRQVSITKRSKPGVKFTKDDIQYNDDQYLSDDDFNNNND